jgi:hypothetical protein
VSALLARYEAEIGGLKEEVETLRSAAKPPRPTPAQTKGKETTRRPEPIASSVRSTPVPSPTKVTPAVSPSSPVASLVRTTKQATADDDRAGEEGDRRIRPALIEEPRPAIGVARQGRSTTTERRGRDTTERCSGIHGTRVDTGAGITRRVDTDEDDDPRRGFKAAG